MRTVGRVVTRGIVMVFLAVPACEQVVPFRIESDFEAPDFDPEATDDRSTPRPEGWSTPYGAMTGTIHYDASVNRGPGCDARIELTGRTYEGGCPDCTFAFDVEAEVVSSGGPLDGCPLVPAWTMVSDGVTINPKLGFSPTYSAFDDVLWFGYGLDLREYGYDLLEGPVWSLIHYDGFSGDLVWDATSLSWDSALQFEYGYGPSPLFDYECIDDRSYPTDRVLGELAVPGALPVDYVHMDVYEVEVAAGSLLRVGVDTVSSADAFQPFLLVVGPDGCIVGANFSAYACSFAPPQGQWCAGAELVAPSSGTYRLVVQAFADIPGAAPVGAYALAVAGAETEPVLIGDDELTFGEWRELQLRTEMDIELEWW
jgi:hypothetical protein